MRACYTFCCSLNINLKKLCLFILVSIINSMAFAQFEGDVVLFPTGCETRQKCQLVLPVRFTDTAGLVWEAPGGLITDGASIPPFFRPILGQPFDKRYIKAALIHDHYCRKHVRPWLQTQKAFYDGLINQGVPESRAKVLLFGVFLGGPKWVSTILGNRCGEKCINMASNDSVALTSPATPVQPTNPADPVNNNKVIYRDSDYHLFNMTAELNSIYSELESNPEKYSLDDLKQIAFERRRVVLNNATFAFDQSL